MNIRRLSTFLGLFLIVATCSNAQVSVTTELPASAAPGGEFEVTLNVNKEDVTGFAKLQQELPTGFEATAGQTSNATFSFKDRKVKFLWMALPNDAKFTVSYKVKVAPEVSGSQIIEGTFAYIKDNATEKYQIAKDIITIGADGAADAQEAANAAILADAKAKEEAEAAAREAAAAEEAPAEEVVEEVVETAEEVVETTEEVVEEVAETATEVINESAGEGNGQEEADRQEAERQEKAAELARLKAEKAKREAEEAKAAADAPAEEAAPAEAAPSYNDAMLKTSPGLVFRVQVLAGPNSVTTEAVSAKLGISETVMKEEVDGMFKYVVGEFGSYRPAKTFSNTLRDGSGVEGPFVVAYKDGQRIHVKEALEMAGQ